MFVHYRTQGIILKKIDQGEADQLFTIYTKDFGKLEILAKAIRKIKSKLRSGIDIFYLSDIEFIQGKTYKTLTDAILIEKFKNLRKNLGKLKIAYKISENLDHLIKGQEPDEKIWQLLKEVFDKLNDQSLVISHWSLLDYYFLWNLLSILGYQMQLQNCVFCQKKLSPEKIYFSFKEGGVICQHCQKKIKNSQLIDLNSLKILRLFLKKDWSILRRLKFEKVYQKKIEKISQDYLSFALSFLEGGWKNLGALPEVFN